MKSFFTLKNFLFKKKWSYIIGVTWLLIIDAVQLIVPQIFKSLTDNLQNNTLDIRGLFKYVFYIIFTGLIIGIGRYFWRIYIQGTSRELEYHLRKKLFNHLLTLSPNYFNTHKTGDLMAHATNDINAVRMAVGPGTVMVVDAVFMIVLSLIMMISTTSLKFTLTSVFTMPIIMILVTRFGKIIYSRFKIVQEAFSDLTDVTQESFSGIRVIKSFVQEDLVSKRFNKVNYDNLTKNLDLVKVHGIFNPLLQFIASISFLVLIFYGGREVINDNISLGDFVAFTSYLGLLMWPTRAFGMVINVFQRGAASMDRLNTIFNEKSEILEIETPIIHDIVSGNIKFDNVYFKYPNTNYYALEDINFEVNKGELLAIVGRTGSGKSTIANLLLRLYDINRGQILIDGINIKKMSLKNLRESIGFVPQENFLFSQSLEDNIAFAFEKSIDMNKVFTASKNAEIYDTIMSFPKQFKTILGERGVTLSGGQRQRTSIARAIIKNPPIIILDDSLSAVDTETEEKILNNFKKATKDITTIIISHRISTIREADMILYLKDGFITERGTHKELLDLNGDYKELYEKQLLEEKLNKG